MQSVLEAPHDCDLSHPLPAPGRLRTTGVCGYLPAWCQLGLEGSVVNTLQVHWLFFTSLLAALLTGEFREQVKEEQTRVLFASLTSSCYSGQ